MPKLTHQYDPIRKGRMAERILTIVRVEPERKWRSTEIRRKAGVVYDRSPGSDCQYFEMALSRLVTLGHLERIRKGPTLDGSRVRVSYRLVKASEAPQGPEEATLAHPPSLELNGQQGASPAASASVEPPQGESQGEIRRLRVALHRARAHRRSDLEALRDLIDDLIND